MCECVSVCVCCVGVWVCECVSVSVCVWCVGACACVCAGARERLYMRVYE